MNEDLQEQTIAVLEPLTVDFFKPGDAEGVGRLVRTVYGESYPVRIFYDPETLIAANADGRNYTIVARNAAGEVVGTTNLFPYKNSKFLYEWGAGMVRPDYRERGINRGLSAFLHDVFIPRTSHIEELYGEPVCNHTHLQRACTALGYVETGLEAALMPAHAFDQEHSAPGRVATLAVFRCCRPKPHRIFLPAVYEAELRWTYGRLDDARDIKISTAAPPPGRATDMEMIVFDLAQAARLTIRESGADFLARLAALEEEGRARNVVTFQAAVDLACPWVGQAVEELRRQGYFFSGVLPRWLDTDGFLMQKLYCPSDFDAIVLDSAAAKHLFQIVRRDWERATETSR